MNEEESNLELIKIHRPEIKGIDLRDDSIFTKPSKDIYVNENNKLFIKTDELNLENAIVEAIYNSLTAFAVKVVKPNLYFVKINSVQIIENTIEIGYTTGVEYE